MISRTVLATCLSLLVMSVYSYASAMEDAPVRVEISSTRDPELKSYRQMYKGLEAFDQQRQLAPAAALKFVLLPVDAKTSLSDLTMRIASEESSVPIAVGPDGSFVLPKIPSALTENADLLLNRRKGLFRWRPDIRSEGVPADKRRLGDLRLECGIWWAVEYDDTPYDTRTLFRLLGGACHSSFVTISFWSPRKLSAAYLVSKDRRAKIQISKNGLQFIPPLYDKGWADDALIEFEFAAVSEEPAVSK
ncbi:hypothetical protein H8L32_19080 [Undibacterium sp. CY18W]|uniref:Uncharacterized protein n=1 Tax=Undibacterium hunanense TaxID=2762292 RepID=A0ABR6ZUW2_9BURK|nr:hypothetical protein [Undibacterium hunanense]MBC3919599.1 hypothetical protein [Undibacterium hunanense]